MATTGKLGQQLPSKKAKYQITQEDIDKALAATKVKPKKIVLKPKRKGDLNSVGFDEEQDMTTRFESEISKQVNGWRLQ